MYLSRNHLQLLFVRPQAFVPFITGSESEEVLSRGRNNLAEQNGRRVAARGAKREEEKERESPQTVHDDAHMRNGFWLALLALAASAAEAFFDIAGADSL